MTDREITRYRKLRTGLHMTATAALQNARLYCLTSDEEHAAYRAAETARMEAHREAVFAERYRR